MSSRERQSLWTRGTSPERVGVSPENGLWEYCFFCPKEGLVSLPSIKPEMGFYVLVNVRDFIVKKVETVKIL